MDKVRFGIVGTGRISDWVLKGAVLDPRFEATAVCSRKAETAKAFAQAHDIPHIFTDIDEMASSGLVDAIYIGTPNSTHADIAIRCMSHGKHVLCEKPFASNAAQARKMIQAARSNNVTLMEAMISTQNPNFKLVQKTLPQIGKVRSWFSGFCQYSSKYGKVKDILSGKSNDEIPASFNPMRSGGALLDIGIYTIYPMVCLFGRPEKVVADVVGLKVPTGTEFDTIDIQGSVQFTYPGMSANVVFSKVADSFLPTEICGEDGNIVMDKLHICRNVRLIPHAAPSSGRGKDAEGMDITCPPFEDEYEAEFSEFIDLVLNGRRESQNNSLENTLTTMEIMDEIRRQGGIRFPDDI